MTPNVLDVPQESTQFARLIRMAAEFLLQAASRGYALLGFEPSAPAQQAPEQTSLADHLAGIGFGP